MVGRPDGGSGAQSGPWTYGFLVNHLWSFANTGRVERAKVNHQTFLQPLIAYVTKGGVTVSINSESTCNWEAPGGEQWTIPDSLYD